MVNKKIANVYGFSLLNTIIAVSLGAVIMAAIWQLYSTVSSTTGQARSKSLLTERSSMALLQLTDDIKASGSFGCFNGRIAGESQNLINYINIPNDFRSYESSYGGLYAFVLPLRNIDNTLAGENIVAGNDILKLQYGVNSAFLTAGNPLTFQEPSYRLVADIANPLANRYALDINGSTANSTYVLASCSRFDQITGQVNANTLPAGNNLLESSIRGVRHDRDSARLMNFITKYYYIGTVNGITGLYSRFLLPTGAMSASQLVIPEAVGLTTQYEIQTNNSRQIKTRTNMLAGDWININQVILTIQLQSSESSGLGSTRLTESITQSILLR
ncbi:PulJ/GspJ family protein [Aquella oligotrophica]|uniref:Type IV pilus assembly protein PilW n=1 Tax=Aquella oligotrophica TaxID=2067065 RepID=A0A2I7N9U9_9NEIS|nr:hypothetical protein [Aquella oligotrophica]AUR53015.1 hypothetical protein CUN60_12170 [Aquella oligotrophica]